MGSIEIAIRYSKRFESLLEREYGAVGKGLHEKLSSVEDKLSQDNVKTLRWIATLRNRAVHEDGFEIDNLDGFVQTCERVLIQLDSNDNSRTISKQTPIYFQKWMLYYFLIFIIAVKLFGID
jgi:hypothetical protein